ncbi:alpha/beta hydrolase [Spongiactinospora sp. TRM90649]|uniref:alpha/beta hydrolase fold domain-containing protein n=1 Tax=Spongiactinospora sp. TRM90649 TaxID=3031114 RepID=UPI0023F9ACE9|nr:alpha/beta hydrolase [Spongiactinospora sp. TRM90649]MDF5758675.1 alpha/beta hydrolase [Spongiactinospora sp. TRM90649]
MADTRAGRAAAVLSAPLIVIPALIVTGVFLYGVPYLGLAADLVPWHATWILALPLAGAVLALYGGRPGRLRAGLLVLAALTLAGTLVIIARMSAALDRAGAGLGPLDAFTVGTEPAAVPDAVVGYSSYQGAPLLLSVYRPAGARPGRAAPVLVYLHGGGWIAGSHADRAADLRWFADRGWLTVSVGYTLSTPARHLWNVTQGQIGCALAWVARHAREYGGDPARLSMTGDSAGGNLAINAAYMAATGRSPSSCGGRVPRVAAVSALYPVADPAGFFDNGDPVRGPDARLMAAAYTGGSPRRFPERYRAIASATYLSREAPPTLLIVGGSDRLVPPEGAYRLAGEARRLGVNAELVRVPYAGHGFDAPPDGMGRKAYRRLTAAWLRDHGQAP